MRKFGVSFLVLGLAASFLLTGCGKTDNTDEEVVLLDRTEEDTTTKMTVVTKRDVVSSMSVRCAYTAVNVSDVLEKDISPLEKKEFSKRAENGVFLPPEKKFGEQFCSSIILDWDFSSELIKKYSVPVKKNNSSCLITLEEGKFHEIRRLFALFENSVIFLKRISAANVFLDEKLLPGQCRTLLKEELDIINQHFF